jgi:hypothetical protein
MYFIAPRRAREVKEESGDHELQIKRENRQLAAELRSAGTAHGGQKTTKLTASSTSSRCGMVFALEARHSSEDMT